MDANQAHLILCRNGVFILPDAIYKSLSDQSAHGFLYMREDEEVLTISAQRVVDGHRRALNARFRVPMFREAKKLAIVNLTDSVRVMVVS